MKNRLIHSATLFGYVDLALASGVNPSVLLRRCGLTENMLQAPDQPIPLSAAQKLLEVTAQVSGCADFGLRLASRRRVAHLGAVGHVMREESTALAALQTLCRYQQLVNPALATHIEQAGETLVIREELLQTSTPQRQSTEMAVGVMHGILLDLMGADWRARRVYFIHREPVENRFARKLFGCPIEYNADFNGLVVSLLPLEAQLPGRDAGLARYSQRSLERALAQTHNSFEHSVRELVAVLLPEGRCTTEQIALRLGMDRRTMHRKLIAVGTTFSLIVEGVRGEFVERHLREGDRSATEIAQILGFASASALAHWFRRSHGVNVTQWRQAVRVD